MDFSQSQIEEVLALPLLTDKTPEKRLKTLYALSNHAEEHYHPVTAAKRNGGRRKILVPDALLKQVQRQILHNILEKQPISEYAKAYHPGAAIRENAAVHLHQPGILKLDIENFFPSILFPDVLSSCFSSQRFSVPMGTLLTNLCCYQGYLPQGAPTSPAISNLVLYHFDVWIGQWCGQQHIRYTRYCDDLTFSGDFDAALVQGRVEGYLQTMGFMLNQKKTRWMTAHQQQMVTGVVVNEKMQVSRAYRRNLRQEIYYCRKYGVQSQAAYAAGKDAAEIGPGDGKRYLQSLLGKINFVLQINPDDAEFQRAEEEVKSWLTAK